MSESHASLDIFASVQSIVIALSENHASVTSKASYSVDACSSKSLAVPSEHPAAQGSEERCAVKADSQLVRCKT